MKVYCFYITSEDLNTKDYPGVIADTVAMLNGTLYSLYAYTQNKEFYKYFKKVRDMSKFIEKIIEVDSFDDFCDNNDNYLLEFHSLVTKGINDYNIVIRKSVEILMTKTESDFMLFYSYGRFVDEITDVLKYSKFFDFIQFNLFNNKLSMYLYQYYGLDTMMYEVFLPFDSPTETPGEEIVIDQVAFYIKIFGNTYKRK